MINFRLLGVRGSVGYLILFCGFIFHGLAFVQMETRRFYEDTLLNEPYGFNSLNEVQKEQLWFARMDIVDGIKPTHIPIDLEVYPEYREWMYSARPLVKSLNSENISGALEHIVTLNRSIFLFTTIGLILHIIFVIILPFWWKEISKPFNHHYKLG